MNLPILLGKDAEKKHYLDLQAAPHLLIAGGSKQERDAFLFQAFSSLSAAKNPDEVKYYIFGAPGKQWPANDDIKTVYYYDTETATGLDNLLKEMDGRYSQKSITTRPFIVALVDGITKDTSPKIIRLASYGRATGIHLLLSAQEVSKKVITGMLKAAFPARIAFRTETKAASRLILDTAGAEHLAGAGEMFCETIDAEGLVIRRLAISQSY